ncbi:hypothetical protein M9Y10_028638 [Tritrichomonas musculus]|uniref:Uncharacterized protein n=1 Tax=Tritrichomonas musculus TaxID=1915356 RepID=A0ABR2KJW5_9EUKA
MANRHGSNPGGDQPNNNNLNSPMPALPNSIPNMMNQGQIPRPPVQNVYSPQNINLIPTLPSPTPAGFQINYSGMSPPTVPVYPAMSPPTQLPMVGQVQRPQQQGSPYIAISPQQPPSVSSPQQHNQQRKSGPTKKGQEGVETHIGRLGLANILYVSNIQPNVFNNTFKRIRNQFRIEFTEEAKIAIALAIKYRMTDAVSRSTAYSHQRRLTLLPSNIYYTDFPIAQFAKLEAERRILSSNLLIKPSKPTVSSSLVNSFDFGFQGQSISANSSAFFQSISNQAQQNNDDFNYLNIQTNNMKNDNDDTDNNISLNSKSSIGSSNLSEAASTANILEHFRIDTLYGIASRVYGKKRDEITDSIGDTEENPIINDQTPLKKLLPSTEKDQNVILEDIYQYIETNSVIPTRTRIKKNFNLQFRKVVSKSRKKPP